MGANCLQMTLNSGCTLSRTILEIYQQSYNILKSGPVNLSCFDINIEQPQAALPLITMRQVTEEEAGNNSGEVNMGTSQFHGNF